MLSYQIFTFIVLKVNNVLAVLLFHSILLVHQPNFQAGNKDEICVKIRSREAKSIHFPSKIIVTADYIIIPLLFQSLTFGIKNVSGADVLPGYLEVTKTASI